jgi:hypothetical protein
LHKVAEVFFGCLVGLIVSWLMSRIWLVRRPADRAKAVGDSKGTDVSGPSN